MAAKCRPKEAKEYAHRVGTLDRQLVVKKQGESSFQFKNYFHMTKPMAIHGLSLKDQKSFVEALSQVSEELIFRFFDLKEAFLDVVRSYPALREQFPFGHQEQLDGEIGRRNHDYPDTCEEDEGFKENGGGLQEPH